MRYINIYMCIKYKTILKYGHQCPFQHSMYEVRIYFLFSSLYTLHVYNSELLCMLKNTSNFFVLLTQLHNTFLFVLKYYYNKS